MNNFTQREVEVLELIQEGKPRKAIANHMKISINTVAVHIRNLHSKTGTRSLNELNIWKIKKDEEEKMKDEIKNK